MAKGFWAKVYYAISDRSTYYFWLQLVGNFGLIVVTVVNFVVFGKFEVQNGQQQVVTTGIEEIRRGTEFTGIFVLLLASSQFYIGVMAVGSADQNLKLNPFDLYGYCTLAVMTNLQIAALYWVAIDPTHQGFRYSRDSDLVFIIKVDDISVGYVMFLVYIGITVLTVVMMWPIYENFIWAQYQVIGLEERLQRAFRTVQIAKSTFLIFFLFTIIQFVNLIYFETSDSLNIIYVLLGVAMLILIRLGYIAVVSPQPAQNRAVQDGQHLPAARSRLHRLHLHHLRPADAPEDRPPPLRTAQQAHELRAQ